MKKFLLPCFLLAVIFLHAQTATVSLSKEFVLKDRGLSNSTGSTYRFGDFFYSTEYVYKGMQFAYTAKLKNVTYGINLYKYTADMHEVEKLELGNGEKQYGPFAPKTVIFGNKILLFYYKAQEDGSIKLLFTAIDPETLTETNTKELYSMTEKNGGLFKMEGEVAANKLFLQASPDKTNLMVSQSGNTNQMFTCVINSNLEVISPSVLLLKNLNAFHLQDYFIDNAGNKYFSYTYTLDKVNKRGVLVQNSKGKEAYLDFNTGQSQWEANMLSFYMSNDNSKLYVYANYYGDYMDEGVLLSTIDAEKLSFGTVQLFPYTDEIREKMNKLGFGSKNKGSITVNRVYYICNELEDGTLTFTGCPYFVRTLNYSHGSITKSYDGPIINIFIKGGKCSFGILYRKQESSHASGLIVMPYKNSLVCIYCDSKKNIDFGDAEKVKSEDNPAKLVLVQAVLNSDGTVTDRQEIGGDATGSNYYFLDSYERTSKKSFVFPIGRERVNLMRYYTELVQWATLEIN